MISGDLLGESLLIVLVSKLDEVEMLLLLPDCGKLSEPLDMDWDEENFVWSELLRVSEDALDKINKRLLISKVCAIFEFLMELSFVLSFQASFKTSL